MLLIMEGRLAVMLGSEDGEHRAARRAFGGQDVGAEPRTGTPPVRWGA